MLFDMLSWALFLGGSFFCLTTGVSLWRLPDFYSRTHGAACMETLGTGMILAACLLQTSDPLVMLKLVFIFLFLLVTGPTSSHALARSALLSGLEPSNCEMITLKQQRDAAKPAAPSHSDPSA